MKKWRNYFLGLLVMVMSLVFAGKVNADTITTAQLVDVINNGTYTQELLTAGRQSDSSYSITGTLADNIVTVTIVTSSATNQAQFVYDASTNVIKYADSFTTTEDALVKSTYASFLMNWVFEATPQYEELLNLQKSYSGPSIESNLCDLTNIGMCLNITDTAVSAEMEMSDKTALYMIAYYNSHNGTNNSLDPVENADTGTFVDYATMVGLALVGISIVFFALKSKKVYKI